MTFRHMQFRATFRNTLFVAPFLYANVSVKSIVTKLQTSYKT